MIRQMAREVFLFAVSLDFEDLKRVSRHGARGKCASAAYLFDLDLEIVRLAVRIHCILFDEFKLFAFVLEFLNCDLLRVHILLAIAHSPQCRT